MSNQTIHVVVPGEGNFLIAKLNAFGMEQLAPQCGRFADEEAAHREADRLNLKHGIRPAEARNLIAARRNLRPPTGTMYLVKGKAFTFEQERTQNEEATK